MAFSRVIVFSIFAFFFIPKAIGQVSLQEIIDRYEQYQRAHDPAEAARFENRPINTWPDVSPAAATIRLEALRALSDALSTLEPAEHDRIDYGVLKAIITSAIAVEEGDPARIPFTGDWGFQSEPLFAAGRTRLVSEADFAAYIARLNAIPAYFDAHIANMRRGIKTGYTAHGDPVATTMDQIAEQIVEIPEESELFAPFKALSERGEPGQIQAYQAIGAEAVDRAISAYRQLLIFMETEYVPAVRTEAGISGLPGGEAIYRAAVASHTTRQNLTPERVHEIGQEEVSRIRAEMEAVIDEVGFKGNFAEFLAFLRSNDAFYAKSAEDLLEKAARISKRLDAILPRYFGRLPRLSYGVEPVPAAIAPGYTTGRYAPGDAHLGLAGTYLVNTYRLNQRPLYELPALSAHEAVPGHHLQIALAQELEGRARYRQNYYATAFGEGWGLYAERIAGEAGIYETPYERFGALSYEMWRACRLVADTGLHWFGWTREKAEACFRENTALAELNIQTEVTRYIGWPGQALGYKIGEITLRTLRMEAEAALGQDFDIRAFHDVVLEEGALPLDVLERRVRAWIAQKLDNPG